MTDTILSLRNVTKSYKGKSGGTTDVLGGIDLEVREGEFVAAGNPIIALLPPENLKVRFFVPAPDFAAIKAGDPVNVSLEGRAGVTARVSFLSPRPEYTPPVLYNRENRAKLVFLIEATLEPADARDLHPGQPVDVTLRK